jgi:hypothetical protein
LAPLTRCNFRHAVYNPQAGAELQINAGRERRQSKPYHQSGPRRAGTRGRFRSRLVIVRFRQELPLKILTRTLVLRGTQDISAYVAV